MFQKCDFTLSSQLQWLCKIETNNVFPAKSGKYCIYLMHLKEVSNIVLIAGN